MTLSRAEINEVLFFVDSTGSACSRDLLHLVTKSPSMLCVSAPVPQVSDIFFSA